MILSGSVAHNLRTLIFGLEAQGHIIVEVDNNFELTIKEIHQFIDATLKTLSKTVKSELKQDDLVPCSIWHCLFNALERYPFSAQQR